MHFLYLEKKLRWSHWVIVELLILIKYNICLSKIVLTDHIILSSAESNKKSYHLQFSFIDEKFYHISLPKTMQLFFLFFGMLQSWQLEFRSTISLFSLKLIFKYLKWKSQCDVRVTRICATLHIVLHKVICDNLIIQVTNFSKGCGQQQKVVNAFSLLRKQIEMITLSDGRTSYFDKIKYFSVKNSVDWSEILWTAESHWQKTHCQYLVSSVNSLSNWTISLLIKRKM